MKKKELNNLIGHFQYCFNQECSKIYTTDNDDELKVDFLLFEPNEDFPFYKVVSAGASDYQMPQSNGLLPNRNEYIIFLSKDFNIQSDEFNWYLNLINYVATYAYYVKASITYSHAIDIKQLNNEKYPAVFINFPEIYNDSYILRCKLSMFKTCACLQLMPMTNQELDELTQYGVAKILDTYYPKEGKPIFLADRNTNN